MAVDTVRILCLHGMGENADIFETLTARLRYELSKAWEFVFVDASTPCIAAPGLSELFPGPYYCHGQTFDTACIAEQHEFLKDVIETEGPFDGVFAFSQGAAVVSSLMLHHALDCITDPPLFRFAVFFCGTLPFTKDASIGRDETAGFGRTTADIALERAAHDREAWNVIEDTLEEPTGKCFQFIPQLTDMRIEIPTVHVFDPEDVEYLRVQHLQLVNMCRPDRVLVVHHNDGHSMPQDKKTILAAAQAIRGTVEKSAMLL